MTAMLWLITITLDKDGVECTDFDLGYKNKNKNFAS
jgi:hypothetical protein